MGSSQIQSTGQYSQLTSKELFGCVAFEEISTHPYKTEPSFDYRAMSTHLLLVIAPRMEPSYTHTKVAKHPINAKWKSQDLVKHAAWNNGITE